MFGVSGAPRKWVNNLINAIKGDGWTNETIKGNATSIASLTNYVSQMRIITQAQWDALGHEKYEDKKLYITDSGKMLYNGENVISSIVTDGLVLWLEASKAHDGGIANNLEKIAVWDDLSGNNLDGTLVNFNHKPTSCWYSDEKNQIALLSDGSNDHVNITNNDLISFGQGADVEFTIDVIYAGTLSSLLTKAGVGSSNADYRIFYENNKLIFGTGASTDTGAWLSVDYTNDSNIHHLICTLKATGEQSGTKSIMLDGVMLAENTAYSAKAAKQSVPLYVLSHTQSAGMSNAKLYSLRIYNKALRHDEMLQNYKCFIPQKIAFGTNPSIAESIVLQSTVDFTSNFFRIPFCEVTNNGVIIAGGDVRYAGGDDLQEIDIGVARSIDNGVTWQDKVVLLQNNGIETYSRKMDGCILVNRTTNRVFVFGHSIDSDLRWEDVTDPSGIVTDFVYKYSDDDGATWSAESSLSALKPADAVTLIPGPGKGITMADGTLVVPVQIRNNHNSPKIQSAIIYSADNGATWQLSSKVPVYSSESQVVEYESGKLMINCKSYISYRRVYVTSDMGQTWTAHETDGDTLIEPTACQAGLDQIEIDGVKYGMFSNPNSLAARQDLTVKVTDDYITWYPMYVGFWGSFVGYSCIANYDDLIILTYEEGGHIRFQNLSGFTRLIPQLRSIS